MKRRVVNSALALSLSAAMVCGTVFSGTAVYAAENIDTAESVEDGSASSNVKKAIYKDGEYYGIGKGRNGEIKLKVTIEDGKISSIENESNVETKRFWNKAVKLFETIVNANSTDVESISGATRSSEGIKQAVEDALEQAEDHGVFDGGSGT